MKAGQIDLFTKRVRRAPPALEFAFTVAVADLLRWQAAPGWRWSHFPSGENRDHKINPKTGQRWSPTGARLKRMGVQSGWPDFILLGPLHDDYARPLGPFFLELKRQGRGKLSDEQKAFRNWCFSNFYPWALAKTFEEAKEQLQIWGVLK